MDVKKTIGRYIGASAAAGLAALATGLLGASPAHAAVTAPGQIELGHHPVPATAPAAQSGGTTLPTALGTLGNPTKLFVRGQTSATSQVMSVPDGPVAWATRARTRAASAGTGELWRFQLVGTVGLVNPVVADWRANPRGLTSYPTVAKYPVYKVVHYDGAGVPTCLDALGGSGAAGSAVGAYGCDPNAVNQPNQLWVVGDGWQTVPSQITGWSVGSFLSETVKANGALTLQNVASLATKSWRTMDAPVLTASSDTLSGSNSRLTLQHPGWPVLTSNSTWITHALQPPTAPTPTPSSSSSTYTCTGLACLVTWH